KPIRESHIPDHVLKFPVSISREFQEIKQTLWALFRPLAAIWRSENRSFPCFFVDNQGILPLRPVRIRLLDPPPSPRFCILCGESQNNAAGGGLSAFMGHRRIADSHSDRRNLPNCLT